MAMGLPIVSFDVPVSREYLDGLGMYAQPGNAASLAEALETALADTERAQALGQRLRQRVIERYSWTAASQSIIDIYDRVSGQ
jgi:glycosyltransferase involved in cell wall biosynthesis